MYIFLSEEIDLVVMKLWIDIRLVSKKIFCWGKCVLVNERVFYYLVKGFRD